MDTFKYSDCDNTKYPDSKLGRYRIYKTEDDAIKSKNILDNPLYRWVIEQTRVGGRMSTAILSRFPNAPITQVLTSNQIDYIQSQL